MARCRRGYTLIEVVISATIMTILLGSLGMATQRGLGLFWRSTASSDVDTRVGRATGRLVSELRNAGTGSLFPALPVPPPGGPALWTSTLDYRIVLDWQAGAIVWSPIRRLAIQMGAGEVDNGVDDDGDGLIDERSIVRIEDPGAANQQTVVLVNDVAAFLEGELPNGADDNGNGLVDERGLSFDMTDGALNVRISLERTGPDLDRIVRSRVATVQLRN